MSPSLTVDASTTMVDLLRFRAETEAVRTAYTLLPEGEGDELSITYGQLEEGARTIAARLRDSGAVGRNVLLLYPSGLDYLKAFFGCLYAGAVAVPAYPPRRNRSLDRIDGIVENSEATHILATETILADLERSFGGHDRLRAMRRIATDALPADRPDEWTPRDVSIGDLAFIQYTSGSTGRPKGVMVSHGNLMHNQRLMGRAMAMGRDDVVLGWLPLYHDMGLIGNVLQSLYAGAPCVLMPPTAFLQRPIRWLRAISRFSATASGGPNFAYDLCVRGTSPEQREGLDLSSWRVAFNGSEPVRAATLERFVEAYAGHGFRAASFLPCYGLAEATLFVTGGPAQAGPRVARVDMRALSENRVRMPSNGAADGVQLVSSGRTWEGLRVRIIDPGTLAPVGAEAVGEITISGQSVACGYWKRPVATDRTFAGGIPGLDDGPALRTGDLGFLHDGELFVTGRLKDLIIIRGRNHYPQDIEATVCAAHPALDGVRGAALGIEAGGEEVLAVVHELNRAAMRNLNAEEIRAAIRKAVSEAHGLSIHTIALLKTGSLPKTTSGKVQRAVARRDLLAGALKEIGRPGERAAPEDAAATSEGVLSRLEELVAKARKSAAGGIDPGVPLSSFGLDSLDLAQLKVSIESEFGVVAPGMEDLLDTSISELAATLSDGTSTRRGGDPHTGGASERGEQGPSSVAADPLPADSRDRTDLFAKCDTDGGYFGRFRLAKDTYFTQPVLEGPIGPRMRFEGREVIVWSINNYLGLAGEGAIHDRARRALEEHGTWAPMGSRLMTGNTERHRALEARFARFLGKEASIVFNYGYLGVIGSIHALVEERDTVIVDSLSHACIIDGAMLASRGRPFRVFRHNDLDSLEEQLTAANASRRGGLLVVTEGLYGMTGDQAPLAAICDLKDRHGARLFIDDAHGFGIMGPTGAGTAEHQGVQERIDLYFGTFAKTFAAIGGVTASEERVVDYVRYNARPNIFAKSLPMVYVEAVDAALDLIEHGSDRRERVWSVARRLQSGLGRLGFDLGATDSPITPVYVPAGDEETAVRAIRLMRSTYGIFVSAVTYPVVPRGVVLFRLTATSAHSDEDVDRTLEAFGRLRDDLGMEVAK